MTEEEWDTGSNPFLLLTELLGTAGLGRKRRLAVCGCCRFHVSGLGTKYDTWIELAERCADGLDRPTEREEANRAVRVRNAWPRETRSLLSIATLSDASNANLRSAIREYVGSHKVPDRSRKVCYLLRDIFGNPSRPIAFDPAWRSSTAVGLAQAMYDARDFAAMPVLADALEESGCDHPDVLAHCRDPQQVHVRGCWVVDLVLGKA